MEKKRLFKSEKNRVFSGLIGGLGDYFDVDPVVLRVLWVVVSVFTGFFPGLIAYIVASLVVPKQR